MIAARWTVRLCVDSFRTMARVGHALGVLIHIAQSIFPFPETLALYSLACSVL